VLTDSSGVLSEPNKNRNENPIHGSAFVSYLQSGAIPSGL
jgi:hypothetical protein